MTPKDTLGNLAILGSTGSIGRQTLDVVRQNNGWFKVVALSAGRNIDLLVEQVNEFKPLLAVVANEDDAHTVRRRISASVKVSYGVEGLTEAASLDEVHTVVDGVVGFAGLSPALAAIEAGKHLALANKESLAAAGPLINTALKESSTILVPVDSEHNSIFQCLLTRRSHCSLRRIVLTASGGPLLNLTKDEMENVTPEQAIKHPRWNMGAKISVDSATLMNKGLEVIEAAMLFGLSAEKIEVLIHPQSIVHGLAEYEEGTVVAALYETDMRVPISHAVGYLRFADSDQAIRHQMPASGVPFLDLAAKESLNFYAPDFERFPALKLCYNALNVGASVPTVLNAANEVAVEAFLAHSIKFLQMTDVIGEVMEEHIPQQLKTINDVIEVDRWARKLALDRVTVRVSGRE